MKFLSLEQIWAGLQRIGNVYTDTREIPQVCEHYEQVRSLAGEFGILLENRFRENPALMGNVTLRRNLDGMAARITHALYGRIECIRAGIIDVVFKRRMNPPQYCLHTEVFEATSAARHSAFGNIDVPRAYSCWNIAEAVRMRCGLSQFDGPLSELPKDAMAGVVLEDQRVQGTQYGNPVTELMMPSGTTIRVIDANAEKGWEVHTSAMYNLRMLPGTENTLKVRKVRKIDDDFSI